MLEINGKLQIKFGTTLNKGGQRPLEIIFEGPEEQRMEVMGVRFINGTILEAMAVMPGGRAARHTRFSPELQLAVKKARATEPLPDRQNYTELPEDE